DRQIRYLPSEVVHRYAGRGGIPVEVVEAFLDRVLVRTGERGVHQIAAVRVSLGDGQLVAVLHGPTDLVDVGEVDLRVHALAEHVQPQGDQADVAGPFTVAEQATLDPIGPGHVAEFSCGDGGSAIVVRMQGQHDGVPAVQIAVHPLDGVGVHVGCGHLHGGRQVDDHRLVRGGSPDGRNCVAHLDRVLQLGAGVGLGGVFEA